MVADVKTYLGEMEEALASHGVASADSQMVVGAPAAEIVKYAEGKGYSLIAMATPGHKFLSDLVHGTTADKVRHNVGVPVLLLRAK